MTIKLDPWGHFAIKEYDKLFKQFGIEPIDKATPLLPKKHYFFDRKIVFGHRDFDKWLQALRNGEKVAVLTGFMPSGHTHLGHLMVIEELRFLQELGAHVKIVIADAEAYAVRRLSRKETIKYGIEYIAHAIAWGLNPEKTEFYFQTAQKTEYYRLIQMFSRRVSMAEMEAIYGDISPGKIIASLTQAADILHLQLPEYGGYKHVLVPVGADQDPHLRLSRDIADRFHTELGLNRPASFYHKFIRGLDGNKMSSSRPDYAIFLLDKPDIIKRKVMMALTGGRATAEEQRKYGGIPEKCTVYELYMYFLYKDDRELYKLYKECVEGKILCGEDKRIAAKLLVEMLTEHQKRYKEVMEEGIVQKIVKIPSF
ncbi:tryptophan--tRNA ligase [Staphylothermus hellenicus]|uniref:Tryptophan--tRNA ligase n=1 Tax=Staphylothermus hellenicus (strain DSM 12710 / JCM 10830 / BK20S6-10-b1 / P8) TaxID=591019 RepID=D7DB97_STAHD|nr:tryptophan--tRNA ligase [Staphylothermus hellenicus]ADI31444.1 tryptophanyl-tRNA synthetase [Staphylothermus hellenicus DSM 12710]